MSRRERRQICFRQQKQPYRRTQPSAVFRMTGLFEILLQMNERSGSLNQTLKEIVIGGVFLQPDLLENIVRLVITPLIPTLEIGPIEWVVDYVPGRWKSIVANQFGNHSRNPLAFI